MVSVFALLACGPKAPPEGSLDISEQVAVSGVGGTAVFLPVPIALGQGYPWTGEAGTPYQEAVLAGEEQLAMLMALQPGSEADVAAALDAADAARESFSGAVKDARLRCIADARYGDVMVEMVRITTALSPPPHADAASREAWLTATAQSEQGFRSVAMAAYEGVREVCPEGSPWHRHASEGLHRLSEDAD